ncbi:hypothetical protein ScPMuIL_000326 [Solemya velum]
MPLGPFGEIVGTTGTLDVLGIDAQKYKSKVIVPRNPKLLKGDEEGYKITPSKFMFDMAMDTEQKLANTHTMRIPQKTDLLDMADTSLQKFSQVNIDEPLFQPFPSDIFFQNFQPFQTYEVPFVLRNNDKVPRLVKVTQMDSPYFKIISPHDVGHKVGPGLPTTFRLQFTPEERKDYTHELVCITEREKFVVPVKAIGARAILDFPDDINFPTGPVKYINSKTLLIRNTGDREAKFTLSTEKPFTVTPEVSTLAIQESLQVTTEFNPQKVGDHKGELVIHYDTGEDVYVHLYGAAQDVNVRLDKNSVWMENTFISMASQKVLVINNRTDVIAHFRWTQFATQEEEDYQKSRLSQSLQEEELNDTDRFLQECISDPSLRDKLSILGRTFRNRKMMIDHDKMLFNDEVVKIEPVEGDIWPNSTFEVNVIFKPRDAQTYTRTVFCDITGRESRLPLRVRGDAIGPKVQFSFETMDMGNIFIGPTHTYEIVMANKGDIDAIYSLLPKSSIFGPCFQFNPAEGIIMPGGHQAIQIMFSSPYLGDFEEEFCFRGGQPEQFKVKFVGSVIGPTFQFDVARLKFRTVSYGFLNTQTCLLMNTSLVPMTFHMRVPGDGVVESICGTSDLDSTSDTTTPRQSVANGPPKEFEIIPASGTLGPQSELKVTVKFISNTIKKYENALVVDVANVGDEVLSLPIYAKCIVPTVIVLSPVLDYGRCFIRHPYEHIAKLHNDSELPAKYELLQQHLMDETPVLFRSPKPKGIIEPHSVCDVPIIIEAQALQEQEMIAFFSIFGSPDPPLPVQLMCIGEGPVVHIQPMDLDWGLVPVLTNTPKTILLSNESLIPAKFTAHMVRPKTVFKVIPPNGVIEPEKCIELTVVAHLDDSVRFHDKLQINFLESQTRMLPLTAYGHGTTVISDPPLTSVLDLGPNFSNRPLKKTFHLTNCGRRHQQLVWSMEGFSPLAKAKKEIAAYNPLDMKYKNVPPPPDIPKPVFKVNPNRFDMPPGSSIEMHLEGFVQTPSYVREKLLCHAIIGRQGGKELIMKVDASADFVSPLLDFSTKSVYFRVDKQAEDDLKPLIRELVISNVSSLALTTGLKLKPPFQILDGNTHTSEMEMHLNVGQQYVLRIEFNPSFKDDMHIRTIDEVLHITYKEHPHVDYIALRGEVYFPNLEFEKDVIDFGCILNDTEVTRYVNITNNSPMEVKYKWSFLIGEQPCAVFNHQPKVQVDETILSDETAMTIEQEVEVVVEDGEMEKIEEEEKGEIEPTKSALLVLSGSLSSSVSSSDVRLRRRLSLFLSTPLSGGSSCSNCPCLWREQIYLIQRGFLYTWMVLYFQVFDILPLYGLLQPGDTEQVTMTFFGHADIWGQAKAICEVEGGPTYEIMLKGEASLVDYRFDCREIDYGKQMFDHTCSAEITLINSGKVGFDYSALNMDPSLAKKPRPGVPIMVPHAGYIEPFGQQTLTVKYLPGVPETFEKSFRVQVAHFEPDEIILRGEGVFPRISLDLPRIPDANFRYQDWLKEAKAKFQKPGDVKLDGSPSIGAGPATGASSHRMMDPVIGQGDMCQIPSELDIQMEIERLAVQDFSLEQQQLSSRSDLHAPTPPLSNESRASSKTSDTRSSRKKTKLKAKLPEYLLDFGYVVLGATPPTHVVHATNIGWFPVSFQVEKQDIHHYGFHIDSESDRFRNLPGTPDNETVDFAVTFDPRGANLQLGPIETVVPINILNGPMVMMRLRACVTMPDMQISDDILNFGEVKCGECKIIMVQLHNYQQVKCDWNSLPTDKERKNLPNPPTVCPRRCPQPRDCQRRLKPVLLLYRRFTRECLTDSFNRGLLRRFNPGLAHAVSTRTVLTRTYQLRLTVYGRLNPRTDGPTQSSTRTMSYGRCNPKTVYGSLQPSDCQRDVATSRSVYGRCNRNVFLDRVKPRTALPSTGRSQTDLSDGSCTTGNVYGTYPNLVLITDAMPTLVWGTVYGRLQPE